MPTPYPKEFRRDVVAVARQGDQSRAQVARSFGISESCLARWLHRRPRDGVDAIESSDRRRSTKSRSASCADATSSSSKRTRSCAARRPTSPATPSQNDVPAGPRPGRRRHPRRGDLPGARLLQAGVLQVVRQPGHRPRLVRRAPDQRRDRHPPRRSRVRIPVHRRRTRRRRHRRRPQAGQRLCTPAAALVGAFAQARASPPARPAGARRPRRSGQFTAPARTSSG